MSASLELQAAIVAALKADSAVKAIVGQSPNTRVFDNVPRNSSGTITADYPLVSLGPKQVVSDDADCITGFEITVQIDCWSRAVGFGEVERLADAVRECLIVMTGDSPVVNDLVLFEFQDMSIRREEGTTSHAILSFRALIG